MFLRNRRSLAGDGLQRVSGRTGGNERARRVLRGSDAIACGTAPAKIARKCPALRLGSVDPADASVLHPLA